MSPFDRCVRLFPPSLRWVPWPPLRGPAVPHLHRYYGVVRLLLHPSVSPLVDPRGLRYPPLLRCERRWRALLGSWAVPVKACLGLETPAIPARPRCIGRYQMLPSARLKASQPGKISEPNPRGLLPRCVRFAPTSRPVSGNAHY